MKKCFDGIAHLDFDPDLNILAALDAPPPKGERLEFTYDQCDHRMINPKDSGALAALYEGAFPSMRLVFMREDGSGAVRTASQHAAAALSRSHDAIEASRRRRGRGRHAIGPASRPRRAAQAVMWKSGSWRSRRS